MVRVDNNTGNLIVEIKVDNFSSAADELQIRRDALYNMIVEHNSEEFISNDNFHGIVLLLKDLDPTFEQSKAMLAL